MARVSEDSRRVGYLKPVGTNHQFDDAQSSLLDPDGKTIDARASAYKDKFRGSQVCDKTLSSNSTSRTLVVECNHHI